MTPAEIEQGRRLVEEAKALLLMPDYSQKAHADMIRSLLTAYETAVAGGARGCDVGL